MSQRAEIARLCRLQLRDALELVAEGAEAVRAAAYNRDGLDEADAASVANMVVQLDQIRAEIKRLTR